MITVLRYVEKATDSWTFTVDLNFFSLKLNLKRNSNMSSTDKKKYENEFSEFLIKKIGSAGGSLQLMHISGHMSQIRPEVRHAIGTSVSDILYFLKKHENLFVVKNSIVSLFNSSTSSGYDSDNSSVKSHSNLPSKIVHGKGVVIKIFSDYGFIKSREPIKTEIYFHASHCGCRNIDLTSFLYIGTVVFFDAIKKPKTEDRAKYNAIKVWKADESDFETNTITYKPRKSRETGLYDPLTLESEGIIQNVFSNLGFIAVKGDDSNTVFFYKNRVVNFENVVDLTKVLSKGDSVEFNAHRSTKPDAKARWEATKVWKVSCKVKQDVSKPDSSQRNQSSLSDQPKADIKNKSKEMKKNQCGKIYPRSHGAVIKFGENELADGDSALYYVCGTQVTEIGWEFSEGDTVHFDAVKIKSAPGWKAVLVWTDNKPDIVLPTCLGDFSEFTDEEENGEIYSSVYTSKSSSYLSESSSSSLKSVSMKSESNTSKTKDIQKRNTKVFDYTVNKKAKDFPRQQLKKHKTSSQDSLNLSPASKSFQQMRKAEKKEKLSKEFATSDISGTISNWGDSPYPADEVYENTAASKNCKPDIPVQTVQSIMIKENNDDFKSIPEFSSSFENESHVITDEFSSSFKTENIDVSVNNNLKNTASVKRFCGIKGTVNKVYSKFAEVKSDNLRNTVSFFWNDFYTNGMHVEELELDDLKQILKVGDNINFNYFIIIDDSGQSWQRVTIAWRGPKPKNFVEMNPEDFIKQHDLSVTINNELELDKVEEDEGVCDRDGSVHRKFLTSFVDVVLDKSVDKLSRTEYFSEEESLTVSQKPQEPIRTLLPVDFDNVSTGICQILKKSTFSKNSKVDLNSISEEIINIILESCNGKNFDTESCNALSCEDSAPTPSANVCLKCREKRSSITKRAVKTRDCEIQTIITGDIISQNIFTEC